MNNIAKETDIYEIICDDFNEITVDGLHYSSYIIYTDYRGIIYKVFIHDNLIGNNIRFFIDNAATENKLILLSFAEDEPLFILLDNEQLNDDSESSFVIGNENEEDIFDYIEYDTINLTYDSENNCYLSDLGNIYTIYDKERNGLSKIIRHFKVIKTKYDNPTKTITKYCLYLNDNNKLYKWFTNGDLANEAKIYYENVYGNDTIRLVIEHLNIDKLSQMPIENIYNDEGYTTNNILKDNKLLFSTYYSIDELQEKLKNEKIIAKYSYTNNVTKDISEYNNFQNDIDDVINTFNNGNSNYLYIRFAPSIDMKDIQAKRALRIRGIYTEFEDNEDLLNTAIAESQIPVFNDNLMYIENKCKYAGNRTYTSDILN